MKTLMKIVLVTVLFLIFVMYRALLSIAGLHSMVLDLVGAFLITCLYKWIVKIAGLNKEKEVK